MPWVASKIQQYDSFLAVERNAQQERVESRVGAIILRHSKFSSLIVSIISFSEHPTRTGSGLSRVGQGGRRKGGIPICDTSQ